MPKVCVTSYQSLEEVDYDGALDILINQKVYGRLSKPISVYKPYFLRWLT
jgi:hypothetical protein